MKKESNAPKKSEKKEKKDKRQRILNAATQLFSQNGYANTRIIDIAHAAEVAKGTVYEYFSSKDELVIEWVKEIGEEISKNTQEAIAGDYTAEEKLQRYFDVKIKTFAIINPLLKFAVEKGHEATKEEKVSVMAVLLALVNREREVLHEIIEEGKKDSGFKEDIDVSSAAAVVLSNVITMSLFSNQSDDVISQLGMIMPGLEKITPESIQHLIINGFKG
ncbi:MAG: TetR/AcrR family transcriptional regulator [Firmicutes bacterium]|nr:TetR/AcrR family transcriptional regulator [Bacillota bacterium]